MDRQAHFDNADHHEGHDTEHSIRHCEADLHERRSGAQYPEFQHIHDRCRHRKRADRLYFGAVRERQLAAETAAKAAKLGIRVLTNARTGKHTFSVYEGRDLTAGNTAGNAPCIFSQEFDNIVEQEYTNSVENLKTTAYVGGEEKEGVTRKVAEVGGSSTGLSRDEVFINATDIVQEYENESGQTVTLTTAQYLALLSARGVEELEQYAETLAFGSKINTNANLKYGTDYNLGDRVTCINKRWNVRIDVRITEIAETYETSGEEIDITFGESLPALLTQIRQITK